VRRDLVLVILIAIAAFGIRTVPAWDAVFGATGVAFLETDAWYHVRLTENQVRNFPWRVTMDPYAAPAGQFVPIAPLFDTITSTIVVILHGREPSTDSVERVAAVMPPIYGTLTVMVVWALGRRLFDRRAGLIGAALLAVLPGHFMDRTMLGFVDHHALEALLATTVLLTLVHGTAQRTRSGAAFAGLSLALYLLAWGSGAFLVAIVGAWLLIFIPLSRRDDLAHVATVVAVASLIALLFVLAIQDPAMHRYGSQVLGTAGLGVFALATAAVAATRHLARWGHVALVAFVAVVLIAVGMSVTATGDLLAQVLTDVRRLAPDPARMGVLEARPLFLYSGTWSWAQPWTFFRTGFFIGAIALVPFAITIWRHRRAGDLLLFVFTLATLIATIGQNRFGYYLVPACAVLGGWLAKELLDWGGVPHVDNRTPTPRTTLPFAREVAVVAVAGAMFAPNLAPGVLLAERTASFPPYWRETMQWLHDNTPPPFPLVGEDYYFARYSDGANLVPTYTVMSWWDQGYWITQRARRVPVANPTQERAVNAARFYTATDEAVAV
jgi:dolichyl-phosphooligosaccharide-protein glycotransferase